MNFFKKKKQESNVCPKKWRISVQSELVLNKDWDKSGTTKLYVPVRPWLLFGSVKFFSLISAQIFPLSLPAKHQAQESTSISKVLEDVLYDSFCFGRKVCKQYVFFETKFILQGEYF